MEVELDPPEEEHRSEDQGSAGPFVALFSLVTDQRALNTIANLA